MLKEAIEVAKRADVAVIFAGLPDAFETEGADRDHMRLPDNQNELIQAVSEANQNTVVVLHGGSPVELPWLHQVPAVLCAYLGGEQVGEGSERMMQGMMMGIQLGALVSYGRMTRKQLKELIASLNS